MIWAQQIPALPPEAYGRYESYYRESETLLKHFRNLAPAKIITPAIRQRLQERLTQARKLSVAQPCPHGQIDELQSLDILTAANARSMISVLDAAFNRINLERSSIGAWESRFATALSAVQASRDNYVGAANRITDADVAAESATTIRQRFLVGPFRQYSDFVCQRSRFGGNR